VPTSTLSFKLFLLCSFIMLGRPQEVFTFLQPMRPALVATLLATAALLFTNRLQGVSAALSTPESKRYLFLFFIAIIGIPFAHHRNMAFHGVFPGYASNVVFFVLLVSQITSLQRLKSLVWVVCLAAFMYGFLAGLLRMESFAGGRFQLLTGNFDPNDTAYVLLALFPLCLYFVQFKEGLLKKLVAVAAICGSVSTIFLTGSRGGILAFGAVLLILLLTRMGGVGKGSKMLFTLVLASTWFLVQDKINVDRYLSVSDLTTDYNVTGEGGRIKLWEEAIELTLTRPITGVGVNCYPSAAYYARLNAGETYQTWHAVHNSFLQIAAELGLVGFTIFLLINLRSLSTFLQISRSNLKLSEGSDLSVLAGLMFLGFVGVLISGFFLSQGYSVFLTFYFALAAAMARLPRQTSTGAENDERATHRDGKVSVSPPEFRTRKGVPQGPA
jgi:O-antigen ligase